MKFAPDSFGKTALKLSRMRDTKLNLSLLAFAFSILLEGFCIAALLLATGWPWLKYALGYTVAGFLTHFIVGPSVDKLWALTIADLKEKGVISDKPTPIRVNETVAFWHGVAERAVYATCIVLGRPDGIAVWLAFKAVIRWKMSEEKDPRHVPGAPIYMIGTAMNVGFGIIGGFIAIGRWSF